MSGRDETGTIAVVQVAVLLVMVVLGGVVTIEVGTLLQAARVATTAADGAALAASAASQPVSRAAPRTAADRIARAHGAVMTACECGGARARVTVELSVTTLLLHHLGITTVTATSSADLVPVPGPRTTATPTPPVE